MAGLTDAERRTWLLLGVLYAAVVIPIGIRKGADLDTHLELAERLLRGLSLYEQGPGLGAWWPPFAVLALTPLALVARTSVALAKAAYALLGVACLVWSVTRLRAPTWRGTALAVAAVAVPLQTNFEYLNINAVLLALVVAAALDLARGRDVRAGAWLGLATALKAFPALLLLYVAYRRRWRAAACGAGVALGLSACALLPYGVHGAWTTAKDWLAVSAAGGWLLHPGNQSLLALLGRSGVAPRGVMVIELLLLALAGIALRRPPAGDEDVMDEVGIVTLLAVLLSPIAWSHYYLLAFPAWVAAVSRAPRTRTARVALVLAAVATSGVLAVSFRASKGVLLEHSIYAWGGLALLGVLLAERPTRAWS